MNKKSLIKIKEHYQSEIDLIKESLSKASGQELDTQGDEVDIIQGNTLQQLSKRLSSRDISRMAQIELALQVIANDAGSFDECEECSEIIGEKRLMVIPGVRVCITCAENAEANSHLFV